MKKNKMMRAASALMVATLLTTSVISGTFAKYTTKAEGGDIARVATWGFTQTTIELDDLFKNAYDSTTNPTVESSVNSVDLIAPGTTGSAEFGFTYEGSVSAPEVAYTFEVSFEYLDDNNAKQAVSKKYPIEIGMAGGTQYEDTVVTGGAAFRSDNEADIKGYTL